MLEDNKKTLVANSVMGRWSNSENINDWEDEGDIRGEEGAKALALVRRKFREAADSAATVALSIDRASAQAGWPLLVGFFLLHDQLAAIQTLPVSTMV